VGQRILFRVDASSEMGAGHVMRCLALAGELARRGGEVHFACRPFSGNLNELIHSSGYHLHELTPPRDGGGERYAAWLGAGWGEDAKESATVAAVLGGVDWLVVDHYALDARWHRALRGNCRRTLVIDDLADRKYDCDILLDVNNCFVNGHNHGYEPVISGDGNFISFESDATNLVTGDTNASKDIFHVPRN